MSVTQRTVERDLVDYSECSSNVIINHLSCNNSDALPPDFKPTA